MAWLARSGAALVVALISLSGTALASSGWTTAVKSRPGLRIPKVIVTVSDPAAAPGFIFLTPRTQYPGLTGPTILDRLGHVVWFHRQSKDLSSQDLRPQVYQGKPVLTWNVRPPLLPEGALPSNAHNTYVIVADSSYRIIKRVRARGRGVVTDTHDFTITPRDTALMLGGRYSRRTGMIDDLVQEIDLKTNRVLFSWSARRHIPISESFVKRPDKGAWDPYHFNSVAEDSDGNLLVSARHTSTIYKIDRHSGRIIWKLGGRDSSFKIGRGAGFAFQHDALRQPDGTLTLFDNEGMDAQTAAGRRSVAKRLRLDTKSMTATLVRSFPHPAGNVVATSQGNADLLANGNMFVGWGLSPWLSEYGPDGRILFAAHFTSIWHHSFHARKAPWSGQPRGVPALAARSTAGSVAAYVSWNGATDVASWRLLGGPDSGSLSAMTTEPWKDFETKLTAAGSPAVVQVEALDAGGQVVGRSPVVVPRMTTGG